MSSLPLKKTLPDSHILLLLPHVDIDFTDILYAQLGVFILAFWCVNVGDPIRQDGDHINHLLVILGDIDLGDSSLAGPPGFLLESLRVLLFNLFIGKMTTAWAARDLRVADLPEGASPGAGLLEHTKWS